ncbi:MAG: DMT family transporter, partial [Moorea sp. SIO2B7]|nr:DMT family transporter [Moorena sp. SIO2B7]
MSGRFRYTQGVLAVVTVALILGSVPVALKMALVYFPPAIQFEIRFVIGAVALTPFFRGFSWSLLRDGLILGIFVFVCFACETIGLETISANRASFVFGLNIVFVTLFEIVFQRRMSLGAIGSSGLTFIGIALMFWGDRTNITGDLWLLAAALCDAGGIIFLEKFAPQYTPIAL